MNLFNVWADGENLKTMVIADNMNEAIDKFCARRGFVDYADFVQETSTDLNIESV